MKAKATKFPKIITARGITGISATVYRQTRTKPDKEGKPQRYVSFIVGYSLNGKRKMEAHSEYGEAETAALDAIQRIAEGKQAILELTNRDREIHQRAVELVAPFGVDLDVVAGEWVEMKRILNGGASPAEAARFYVKFHAKELPKISVADAVKKCLEAARADGKSKARLHQLECYLNPFAMDMNVMVSELTPGIISRYLTGLSLSERSKKNCRDVLGFFGRWLVLHGYLNRGTDLVEGVQRYSMKPGAIKIFTPREMSLLIENADDRLVPYLVIGAFTGLRQAEIQRLDWSEIDLDDGYIEVKAEKSKVDTRRLVPITPNLKAWLTPYRKKAGAVCPFKNVVNELMDLIANINKAMPEGTPDKDKMTWKKNGLRHSCISYRVAQSADVARIAEESGNSVAIIRSNYLKRVKPPLAAEWFSIMPAANAESLTTLPRQAKAG